MKVSLPTAEVNRSEGQPHLQIRTGVGGVKVRNIYILYRYRYLGLKRSYTSLNENIHIKSTENDLLGQQKGGLEKCEICSSSVDASLTPQECDLYFSYRCRLQHIL